jgi:hypothetical protein
MADVRLVGIDDNGGTSAEGSNLLLLQQFVAVKSGAVTAIKAKIKTTGNVMVALYADSSDSPTTVITSSGSTAVTGGTTASISVNSANVVSGTKYWIAYNQSGGCVAIKSATGKVIKGKSATYSGFTFPANPTGLSSWSTEDHNVAGWGAEASVGNPNYAFAQMM